MQHTETTRKHPPPRFEPGVRVQFQIANRVVRGKVTEYRGPLAVGGKHLYLVEVPFSDSHVQPYEIPEEELTQA